MNYKTVNDFRDIKTVHQLIKLIDLAIDIIGPVDEQNYASLDEVKEVKLKFQQIDKVITNLKFQHVINFSDDKLDMKVCQQCLSTKTPQLSYCKKKPCKSFPESLFTLESLLTGTNPKGKGGRQSKKSK